MRSCDDGSAQAKEVCLMVVVMKIKRNEMRGSGEEADRSLES